VAISAGNLELIKLKCERLAEAELADRRDLIEVAADCDQPEVFVWLLRDSMAVGRQLFGVIALEGRLADAVGVAFHSEFRPWWGRARKSSSKWRTSAKVGFVSARGLSGRRAVGGRISRMRPHFCQGSLLGPGWGR
jgi:hypothetical protein